MLDVVADRLLGVRAGDVMGIVSIISIAASISAMTFAGPRVYYAMARDGAVLPRRGAHPSPVSDAGDLDRRAGGVERPARAVGQRQRADDLHRLCRRAVRGRAVVALFVLRQREPNAPRPFRAWGYPIAPAIFAIASLAIVLNALWADLVDSDPARARPGARRPRG